MPYVWNGSGPLRRSASNDGRLIAEGDEFEPTEAELESFGDLIDEVTGDDAQAADDEGENAASESDDSENPDYSQMDYEELRQLAADAETDEVNGRSSKDEIVAYFEGQ